MSRGGEGGRHHGGRPEHWIRSSRTIRCNPKPVSNQQVRGSEPSDVTSVEIRCGTGDLADKGRWRIGTELPKGPQGDVKTTFLAELATIGWRFWRDWRALIRDSLGPLGLGGPPFLSSSFRLSKTSGLSRGVGSPTAASWAEGGGGGGTAD